MTATIEEVIDLSLETGIDLQACRRTSKLTEYDEDDLLRRRPTGVGAATALHHMAESSIQLLG